MTQARPYTRMQKWWWNALVHLFLLLSDEYIVYAEQQMFVNYSQSESQHVKQSYWTLTVSRNSCNSIVVSSRYWLILYPQNSLIRVHKSVTHLAEHEFSSCSLTGLREATWVSGWGSLSRYGKGSGGGGEPDAPSGSPSPFSTGLSFPSVIRNKQNFLSHGVDIQYTLVSDVICCGKKLPSAGRQFAVIPSTTRTVRQKEDNIGKCVNLYWKV